MRWLMAVLLLLQTVLPVLAYRTYNGNNQRSNTGYAYDGNGNPTTYAGTTCTYDVENRLTAFGSEGYAYRADGLRASVGSGTSKVYYLYDQGNAVCQLDYQGNLLRTYVYAPDGMVGRTGSSQTRYYLFDWQGNVEHSMSSSTNLNVSYAFNAWGQRNQKFPVNADVGANDQFGYNARWGYMRENTTGFYYCQNRYYDPANGRWLTRDPIGFAGGMNVYGYCGGGPVGSIDPEGLIDSVSAFCRRFPAFCMEIAEELGWAGGAGGAGAGGLIGKELSDGDNDEAALAQEASQFLGKCWSDLGNQFFPRFGQAAHRVLNNRFAGNGYEAEQRLDSGGIPDLTNRIAKLGVEWKPTTASGIGRGLSQIGRYQSENPGWIIDVVPYPTPWDPTGWQLIPVAFRGERRP